MTAALVLRELRALLGLLLMAAILVASLSVVLGLYGAIVAVAAYTVGYLHRHHRGEAR